MKAEVFNASYWIEQELSDPGIQLLEQGVVDSGFVVVGKVEHAFEPVGYTRLLLLAESHFALHTFPEEQKTYIEICSCNQEKLLRFIDWLENHSQLTIKLRYRHDHG